MTQPSSLLTLKIDTRGLKSLSNRLKDLASRVQNVGPFVDDASAYMVNVTVNRILRTKKGPDGTAWPELSGLTQELKGHGRILFETGALAKSIVAEQSNKRGFAIVAGAEYAPYMHYGVKKPRGWIRKPDGSYVAPRNPTPARPFMGLSEENVRRITKMLRAHVLGEQHNTPYAAGFE